MGQCRVFARDYLILRGENIDINRIRNSFYPKIFYQRALLSYPGQPLAAGYKRYVFSTRLNSRLYVTNRYAKYHYHLHPAGKDNYHIRV
jgi:hypothetical protein